MQHLEHAEHPEHVGQREAPLTMSGAASGDGSEQLTLWPEGIPGAASSPRTRMEVATGWPLAAVRAPWVRRTLVALVVVGMGSAVLLPRQARAVIPVIDAGAITQLVTTIARLSTQISIMTNQYNAFVNNTRKLLSPYAWRNVNATIAAVDGVVSSGAALTYSTTTLAGELGATFPGYSWNPGTITTDMRTQKERALGTAMQQVLGAQQTWVQIGQSVAALNQIKAQVGGITSAQQAAEVNATIGVLGAEELTLLRQQLLASTSTQAVIAAEQLQQRLQAAAAVAAFEAPAAAIALSPPVRPRMDVAAYTF